MSDPRRDVDVWGRSRRIRGLTRRLLGPAYRWWFRVDLHGLEHIPDDGPAVLVANHAGALPVDATLIMQGIETEVGRSVYALHHEALRALPVVGTFLARNGGVVAHPENAQRLLEEGNLVLVFPEGTKGTTKPFSKRYQLQRFGRGGFAEAAMRAGAPVVPVLVVGGEETMPSVATLRSPQGEPVPITINGLLGGPALAYLPLPVKVRIRVLEPIELGQPAGLASYPSNVVADAAEQVREHMQRALDELVAERRSILGG